MSQPRTGDEPGYLSKLEKGRELPRARNHRQTAGGAWCQPAVVRCQQTNRVQRKAFSRDVQSLAEHAPPADTQGYIDQ
jgi:hypothetical protein